MADSAPQDRQADGNGGDGVTRRAFLGKLGVAVAGLAAAVVSIPFIGFLLSPLTRAPEEVWRRVGAVDDFAVGETALVTYLDPNPLPWAGFAAETAAWLRRVGESEFVAFSVYCTHTGCPVRWLSDAGLFVCPCHGGVFRQDGDVAAGPPNRPLARLAVRVRDGVVEIAPARIPTGP